MALPVVAQGLTATHGPAVACVVGEVDGADRMTAQGLQRLAVGADHEPLLDFTSIRRRLAMFGG